MAFRNVKRCFSFVWDKHKAQVTYGISWWLHSLHCWVAHIRLHYKPSLWSDITYFLLTLSGWWMTRSPSFWRFLLHLLVPCLSDNQSVNKLSHNGLILKFPPLNFFFLPLGCFSNPPLGNHSCITQRIGSTNEANLSLNCCLICICVNHSTLTVLGKAVERCYLVA